MGVRSFLGKPFAAYVDKSTKKWSANPVGEQLKIYKELVSRAKDTRFGRDHHLYEVNDYRDFKESVPVRDYEGLDAYIKLVLAGEQDILWPGLPEYLAKTSGTTSGTKYIPITKDSIPNHMNSARNALFQYVHETGNYSVIDGKMMFLSGSPTLTETGGIKTGRLSGLVNHHIPQWLRANQLPSYETNCIEDWELKVDKIVEETMSQDMRLISGIPPWVQMYFDRLVEKTGKYVKELFPDFSLFVYGGVNFEPYRHKLFESIGQHVDSIETYPASEGFIAYQDSQKAEGLLLLLNSGIFYEFIPADQYYGDNPTRLMIDEVELGVNYALVINSNAGLWGYSIGDTVKFVSKEPYRLIVTGRIKHFISAFGEHVIGEEVEKAMKLTCAKFKEVELVEFTVAPNVTPETGLPLHEWFIEFARMPNDKKAFGEELNRNLQELNTYYDDLITGSVLRPLEVVPLKHSAFIDYMKSKGKLGSQNKVPRLSNDRKIADQLMTYKA